jgi:hypothetical protein
MLKKRRSAQKNNSQQLEYYNKTTISTDERPDIGYYKQLGVKDT